MRIINLTPHSVTFVDDVGNTVLTVDPSGQVVREKIGDIKGEYKVKSAYYKEGSVYYGDVYRN